MLRLGEHLAAHGVVPSLGLQRGRLFLVPVDAFEPEVVVSRSWPVFLFWCLPDVSPDSPDSPDCEIAAKRKVRWTWICQSSEPGESVKRAFRPGLSRWHLANITPPHLPYGVKKAKTRTERGAFGKNLLRFDQCFQGCGAKNELFFSGGTFGALRTVFAAACKHGA